jgi:hypothetical protein
MSLISAGSISLDSTFKYVIYSLNGFTVAPVRQYICHCKWKKSTKPLKRTKVKNAPNIFRNKSVGSNCPRVQIIPKFYSRDLKLFSQQTEEKD